MSERVFVAGATGVLGRRVVPALVGAGHSVTANVRDDRAHRRALEDGASPATVDLFDVTATRRIGAEHDVIVNIATAIPTGARALRPSAWKPNDRLRTEAAANLAAAAAAAGGRYIGESITFPYVDRGERWIDEGVERSYATSNASVADAEAAAASVAATGVGVSLRFAMFFADDSAHVRSFVSMARRGLFGLPGPPEAFISFIHVDDAAAAVVGALDVPSGVYNIAEADPVRRADHRLALERVVGRRVRALPPATSRLGGAALATLARSQRISSASFSAASGWRPTRRVVDEW